MSHFNMKIMKDVKGQGFFQPDKIIFSLVHQVSNQGVNVITNQTNEEIIQYERVQNRKPICHTCQNEERDVS